MPATPARRVAVMAHFDPDGLLADHVRLFIDQLLTICERVVLVTTSGVGPEGGDWVRARPTLQVVERPNVGHDFMSYRLGLEVAQIDANHEVIVCNDSFVGVTVPLDSVWRRMARKRCDFWGMTWNTEISPHVQSYFMVFRPVVVASPVFRAFWEQVAVLPDKKQVIHSYEVGLSTQLLEAGFGVSSYFSPSAAEIWKALARVAWLRRPEALAAGRVERLRLLLEEYFGQRRRRWNPTILLADRVLDGRLPVVKLQVFREDPAHLGADRLLARCEVRFPELFAQVRPYLERTSASYATSPADPTPTSALRSAYERVRY